MWVKKPGGIPRTWEEAREKTLAIWREKKKEEEKKEAEEELGRRIKNPIQRDEIPPEAYPRRGYTNNQWRYPEGGRASGRDRCDKVRHHTRGCTEEIKGDG
jgi:hypothetical protein